MKRSQLFGTDGIRGVAGEYPLDERTVHLVGRALGKFLNTGEAGKARRVLIGQDTRESSRWIADTLAAGLSRENVSAVSAGVLPTAGVAYLSRLDGYAAGVMISASHNPYQDNGIKVFAHTGYKLPDADELRVEGAIFRLLGQKLQPPALPHSLREDPALRGRYEQFLRSRLRGGARFDGMRVVLDCANVAATSVAPELFEHLGAEVIAIHAA
ncbi:MAG: phosphoglucosamine mutase, partial [Gammaproteobacteria bacterium]